MRGHIHPPPDQGLTVWTTLGTHLVRYDPAPPGVFEPLPVQYRYRYQTVCGPRPDGRGLVGVDGCEVRLCDPCARHCPVCVPAPPVSFYRYI